MADYNRTAKTDAYQIRDNTINQAGEGVNGWDTGSQYLLLPATGESNFIV